MSLFNLAPSICLIPTTVGLIAFGNLLSVKPVNAFGVTFNNGGFEDPIVNSQNSWSTIGDVTISPEISGIAPTSGTTQAIITTGYAPGDYDSPIFNRDDDNSLNFNQSTNLPVLADTNDSVLQDHFGFNPNAFSIERTNETLTGFGPRTSKEGSGMYQEFQITLGPGETSFGISFDWAFASNDGTNDFGDQDFAFWSLGQYDAGSMSFNTVFDNSEDDFNNSDEIVVLQSSNSAENIETLASPTTTNDYLYEVNYDNPGNTNYTYLVDGLTPGETYTYRLGYGVVDVDGLDRTSTLLIDNVKVTPFDFSPGLGLGILSLVIGIGRLRHKFKQESDCK